MHGITAVASVSIPPIAIRGNLRVRDVGLQPESCKDSTSPIVEKQKEGPEPKYSRKNIFNNDCKIEVDFNGSGSINYSETRESHHP